MAGTKSRPANARPAQQTKNIGYIPVQDLNSHSLPETFRTNIRALEELGLFSDIDPESLGQGLWQNASYTDIHGYLSDLPAQTQYRTVNTLVRNLLLTQTDTSFFKTYKRNADQSDLFTLRLKALIQKGAFEDAGELYAQMGIAPYNQELANLGVSILFANHKGEIACLETLANFPRFTNNPYWIILKSLCHKNFSDKNTHELSADEMVVLESERTKDNYADYFGTKDIKKALMKAAEKNNYKLKPKNTDQLSNYSSYQFLPLAGLGKVQYNHFSLKQSGHTTPFISGLILANKDIPKHIQFYALKNRVRSGHVSTDLLTDFYTDLYFQAFADQDKDLSASIQHYDDIKGWKRPAYLYQLVKKIDGTNKNSASLDKLSTVLSKAVDLEEPYGIESLYPFAPYIQKVSPEKYKKSDIHLILRLLVHSNQDIEADWLKSFMNFHLETLFDRKFTYVLLALGLDHDLSKFTPSSKDNKLINFKDLSEDKKIIIYILYEKLDKLHKLHNYADLNSYEKEMDLTLDEDYVMPLDDFLNKLSKAKKNKSIGEVILLVTSILHQIDPKLKNGYVIAEAVDGLVTVGLTSKAHFLTKEVFLGFE